MDLQATAARSVTRLGPGSPRFHGLEAQDVRPFVFRALTPSPALDGKNHVGALTQFRALSYGDNPVVMARPCTVTGGGLSQHR